MNQYTGSLLIAAVLFISRALHGLHIVARQFLSTRGSIAARIATENLVRNLRRNATTASALTVGVAMTASFAVFVTSFVMSIVEWVDETIPADILITNAASVAAGFKNVPMTDELFGELSALPGVEAVGRMRRVETDYQGYPVLVIAGSTELYRQRAQQTMLEGTEEGASQALLRGGAVVSEAFSRHFGVHRGDQIALNTKTGTHKFEVAGVMVEYQSDIGSIVLDQAVFARAWGDNLVDTYTLFLQAGADPEAVREKIRRAYAERFDLFILTNREFKTELISRMNQVFVLMHTLELVAIIVAVLGVMTTLSASVLDRTREIGVLRALGMHRGQTRLMVMFEALLIGLAGGAVGIGLGLALGYILLEHINVAQMGWRFPFYPPWPSLLEVFVLAIIASLAAAWYPARQAASLVVSDALERV